MGMGSCQKWWPTMVSCCEGKEKGRREVVSGRRKRRAEADGRWMLMARERKRELRAGGISGLRLEGEGVKGGCQWLEDRQSGADRRGNWSRGTSDCQKLWPPMGELVAVRSGGLQWSTVVKGNKKKRKKAVNGWRRRYVGADERGTLMARERKRELVAVGSGGLRWSAIVKENKKKRRKVVSGWRKR
ncbi:hypothetical protein OIU79_030578 [Salix purpurea]|uniref:Uncharacterized protein n=1 Tax=Salix purpurea TaxID=77065 RepID=A0A9Q0V8U5_SALPP|nr:hypothetical protein OIU79_030578 [Salix purpurea]